MTIAGKSTTIGPGSAAYVHSGEEHGVRNIGQETAQYFVVAVGSEVVTCWIEMQQQISCGNGRKAMEKKFHSPSGQSR